jgi:hypothetical protein
MVSVSTMPSLSLCRSTEDLAGFREASKEVFEVLAAGRACDSSDGFAFGCSWWSDDEYVLFRYGRKRNHFDEGFTLYETFCRRGDDRSQRR